MISAKLLLLDSYELDINKRDYFGCTSLYWAIKEGHCRMVKLLIDNGALINTLHYGYNKTPLTHAVERNRYHITKYNNIEKIYKYDNDEENKQIDVVDILLSYDADVNLPNKQGYTPLMVGVTEANENMVNKLLENGADVNRHGFVEPVLSRQTRMNLSGSFLSVRNQADNSGKTALMIAISEKEENIVHKLLENNANVNQVDNSGKTGLIIAVSDGDENMVNILLDNGAKINQADYNGRTPLIWAATGYYEMIDLLLQKGANINQADNNGNTALMRAVRQCHATTKYHNTDIIRLLLYNGANVKLSNNEGKTALIIALNENCLTSNSIQQSSSIVLTLLRTGDIDLKEVNKALDVAIEKDYKQIAELLRSHLHRGIS